MPPFAATLIIIFKLLSLLHSNLHKTTQKVQNQYKWGNYCIREYGLTPPRNLNEIKQSSEPEPIKKISIIDAVVMILKDSRLCITEHNALARYARSVHYFFNNTRDSCSLHPFISHNTYRCSSTWSVVATQEVIESCRSDKWMRPRVILL